MRTIITFLNDKGLKTGTTYSWQGKVYEGGVFSLALRQFISYDRMLVCNTPEAEKNTWPDLVALNDPRIEPVYIPRGESTTEMWQMFDAVTERVTPGDTVIFDITHGLRSLPFLVFLFAAYLKTAKNVNIEAIYYGALELGNQKEGKPAPVIDLSEFVTMLDWLTATDRFKLAGDARQLSELLNPKHEHSGAAANASKALSSVSQAAVLCQPFSLMLQVKTLENQLVKAEDELAQRAHPFGLLRDDMVSAFRRFEADYPGNILETLQAEYRLFTWYYHNKQLIQAVTLAREWLIDAVTYRLGQPISFKPEARSPFERAVSGVALVGHPFLDNQTGVRRTFTPEDLNQYGRIIFDSWPECKDLAILWYLLGKLRNALDHAEHQNGSMKLATILKRADETMPLLERFALGWGLAPVE
jgi:CRISPR-associated Csx2 family protein